jgi:S1-C subfamily serine protease
VAFKKEATAAGFALFQAEVSAFDSAPVGDPDYRLGATLLGLNYQLCNSGSKEKGSLHVDVKWEVFSVKQQRVVLTKTIAGDYKADSFQDENGVDFESRGFAAALSTLFALPEMKALIAGRAPQTSAPAFPELRLKPGPLLTGDTQRNSSALLAAVVVIFNGEGGGSGFYIADGYVLTARHVVGSAKYVKVKLADGKEVVGEVVREDGVRDVALLKTESLPLSPFRLHLVEPQIGTTVFAIGSPLGQELAGSLTKGVISGSRNLGGASYLQSDVTVNPGNSGGPLLDDASRVLAIAELKLPGAEGLAFFIPIKDAMDKLNIKFDDAAAR